MRFYCCYFTLHALFAMLTAMPCLPTISSAIFMSSYIASWTRKWAVFILHGTLDLVHLRAFGISSIVYITSILLSWIHDGINLNFCCPWIDWTIELNWFSAQCLVFIGYEFRKKGEARLSVRHWLTTWTNVSWNYKANNNIQKFHFAFRENWRKWMHFLSEKWDRKERKWKAAPSVVSKSCAMKSM